MSHGLTIETRPVRCFYPDPASEEAEEQAVIQTMQSIYANCCIQALNENPTRDLPILLRFRCALSNFTPLLQEYLLSKGCSKAHEIEVEINFKDIMARIQKVLHDVQRVDN
jgi:hypothetical protein